eukprot:10928453-Alexandrium_andersonii.AAC.1
MRSFDGSDVPHLNAGAGVLWLEGCVHLDAALGEGVVELGHCLTHWLAIRGNVQGDLRHGVVDAEGRVALEDGPDL